MRKLLTAIALSTAALAAQAATPTAQPYKGELPTVLQFAKGSGLEIYNKFPAQGGLDGWIVKDQGSGKQVVIYTSADGSVMLAGMMLDKTGKNLTAEYTEQFVAPPDYSAALADFNKAASVMVGKSSAKAELTVAFDPNCGFCKLLHRLLEPSVAAGELKVRYVPVAILGADSDRKAAAMLESKDVLGDVTTLSTGGAAKLSTNPGLLAKVQENTQLMRKHGFNGTPAVLYKTKAKGDETVFVSNGVPNMTELFDRLGISGQTDKLKADPNLARFLR